jgi:DNA-directed RNA polymerase subunit RPC12/RpoP
MEKTTTLMKMQSESSQVGGNLSHFKCERCGEEFQTPLLATVFSTYSAQRYFACPRCLTKVDLTKESRTEEKIVEQPSIREKAELKEMPKLDDAKCNHFLGYLKRRPKDAPIPDDCLTCEKMIECLAF